MLTIFATTLTLMIQTSDFTTDKAVLGEYMVQACIVQQGDRNGATPDQNRPFCTCLETEFDSNVSDEIYRIMALGGQGAIGERAQIDAAAAQTETQRLYAELSPEDQASLQPALQTALGTCLELAPQTESQP